jgi:ammonium transporter, Amt family
MVQADIAWMLVATLLVLFMTAGLAFFYSGLVRSKNTLNTLMMCFAALGFVGLGWAVAGYSIAFGPGSAIVGDLSHLFLRGVGLTPNGSIPDIQFMAFQGTFAIITAALIAGAVVERMRFPAFLAFIVIWSLVIYAPIAHWVWGGGWLENLGALDFAGGTVVHINAGIAAVVAALVIGARKDYGQQAILPHQIPFTMLGAAILWIGWFGFNAGSALAADEIAVLAFVNTMFAPMATIVVWGMLDLKRNGTITGVGMATAIVVGLVAITPAAGFVGPIGAIALGAIAAVPSYYVLMYRARTRLDDSLDVFAAHGVAGLTGALLTGVLAQQSWNGNVNGLLFGDASHMVPQVTGILAVAAFCAIGTFGILKLIGLVTELRVDAKSEGLGLDVTQHGEQSYTSGEGAILVPTAELKGATAGVPSLEPALQPQRGEA